MTEPVQKGGLPPLTDELAAKQKVFRAPPLDQPLIDAIKLITPHFDLQPDEESRRHWEADQNGSCWGEFEALGPLLASLPKPTKVLEIGPGLGRSAVFFKKMLGWETVPFHLYESDGLDTKYAVLGPRSNDSFCGSLASLKHCLDYNAIEAVEILDARSFGHKLSNLPGPYDLIYGFYSIGFHWALEHFLEELLAVMHRGSVAFFTVPARFVEFDELKRLDHRILTWRTVWPKGDVQKLLVFSKERLPAA